MSGAIEQKNVFAMYRVIADDPTFDIKERVIAWCEWGRMARNSADAALALRKIQELTERS